MFDPYHEWLAIPKEHRPATYYQLLGVDPSESNPKVIETACIRQSKFIRTFQNSANGDSATQLLTELAEARAILLDPVRRKEYDARNHGPGKGIAPDSEISLPIGTLESPRPASPSSASNVISTAVPLSKRIVASMPATGNESYQVTAAPETKTDSPPRRPPVRRTPVLSRSQANANQSVPVWLIAVVGVTVVVGGYLFLRPPSSKPRAKTSTSEIANRTSIADVDKTVQVKKEEQKPQPQVPKPEQPSVDPPAQLEQSPPKRNAKPSGDDDPRIHTWSLVKPEPSKRRRTGFTIGASGYFLTTSDLLEHSQSGLYAGVNREQFRVHLVARSDQLGLALLKLEGAAALPALNFAAEKEWTHGDKYQVVGFRHFGLYSKPFVATKGEVVDTELFLELEKELDASIIGAPLLDSKGDIAGVFLPRYENDRWKVKLKTATEIQAWVNSVAPDAFQQGEGEGKSRTGGANPLDCVGIAVARTGQAHKRITDGAKQGKRELRFAKCKPLNDEHNLELIDEAIEMLGHREDSYRRAALRTLQYCVPVYRRAEVLALVEPLEGDKARKHDALIVIARFDVEHGYDRVMPYMKNAEFKSTATAALGASRDRGAFARLYELSSVWGSYEEVADALEYYGEGADVALIKIIQDKDDRMAGHAIETLHKVGDDNALNFLKMLEQRGSSAPASRMSQNARGAIVQFKARLADIPEAFSISFARPQDATQLEAGKGN